MRALCPFHHDAFGEFDWPKKHLIGWEDSYKVTLTSPDIGSATIGAVWLPGRPSVIINLPNQEAFCTHERIMTDGGLPLILELRKSRLFGN